VAASLKKRKSKTRAVENLSARVYNQIKTLILCNEILPGQKLHHQQLSERLGVSRTPVREALTRLVQEGYVSFLPNRGFTCKEIRMQEAEELYELREALEAFAVEKAIANLTDAALARLRAKIKYRPVVFELMSAEFTLLQLQRSVEALAGRLLHKQNFRRLMEQQQLVEETGAIAADTVGRPAKLFRFRHDVLAERAITGTKLPLSRT